jgi:MGT family glycosyltransferase
MARVLAYTSPARGHLYPVAQTLLELAGRGHEVNVRTLASEVGALRALGLRAEPVAPEIEALPLDDWRGTSPQEAIGGVFRTFAARATHEVPDLRRAMADLAPDLLMIDTATPGAAAVAEASSLPWVEWIPFFEHFEVAPGAPPGLTRMPYTLAPDGMDVLDAPRRALGLAPLAGIEDAFRAPLSLYFTAEPFEVGGLERPPTLRLVGPGLWEPPAEAPRWLDELEDPLVLVTASSEFQRDDALVSTALAALGGEDLRVAVSTVAHDPAGFAVPGNARVERWLPHGPAVRRAACVVCHGGMGITQRALAAGVPVCVVPFGRDQLEVAARVAATGAGTVLTPDALTPGALLAAVRGAMTMGDGARLVAEGFARAGGAPAAADAVEALL